MTKKEAQLFTSLMFYVFTIVLTSFVFVFPVMVYLKYSAFAISLTLFVIGLAFPSILMVILHKCFWLVSSIINRLFQKYSLPLIGHEQSHKTICTLETKIFTPLRNLSLIIVICHMSSNLASGSSLIYISTFFEIFLQLVCWGTVAIMAINGLIIYSICLFEITMQFLLGYKKPKRLQKVSLKAVCANLKTNLTEENRPHIPRRLSPQETLSSENIFSLKTFVVEAKVKITRRFHIMKSSITKTLRYFPTFIILFICLISLCTTADATTCGISEKIETVEANIIQEEIPQINHTGWFYEQLNEMERVIYNGFAINRDQLMDGKEVSISFDVTILRTKENEDIFRSLIMTAKRAYLADHPAEKIWMDNCKLFLSSRNGFLQIIVRPQSKFDPREATESFEKIANKFVDTLTGTDREKLQAIHNWLVSNVQYDLTADNNGNAYGAIVEGRSVCSGFASSFKYLADKAGLNVVYVQGYYHYTSTDTYGYHAWNMAEVDGEWILIDVTFDQSLQNFNLSSWQNSEVHFPDSLFTYPS